MRHIPVILAVLVLCACAAPTDTSDTPDEDGTADVLLDDDVVDVNDTLEADTLEVSDSDPDADPCQVLGRDGVFYVRIDAVDPIELDALELLADGCVYTPVILDTYDPGMGEPATDFDSPLGPPDVVVPDGSGGWVHGVGRTMTLEPGAYAIFAMNRGVDIGDVLVVYEARALTEPGPRFLVTYGFVDVLFGPESGLATVEGVGPQFVSPPAAF